MEVKIQIVLRGEVETVAYYEELRALRGDKSQECIANEIGITKSSWAMYERGERIPRDEVKIRIADFFGKSVQEIFFGQQEHK